MEKSTVKLMCQCAGGYGCAKELTLPPQVAREVDEHGYRVLAHDCPRDAGPDYEFVRKGPNYRLYEPSKKKQK